MRAPSSTSDCVPTMAINQPPWTTLTLCSCVRKVSTLKARYSSRHHDVNAIAQQAIASTTWPCMCSSRPTMLVAATSVKKENTMRGFSRSSRTARGWRSSRSRLAASSSTHTASAKAPIAPESVSWPRVCRPIDRMPLAMTSAKLPGCRCRSERTPGKPAPSVDAARAVPLPAPGSKVSGRRLSSLAMARSLSRMRRSAARSVAASIAAGTATGSEGKC